MVSGEPSVVPGSELTIVFVSYGSVPMILESQHELLACGRFAITVVENDPHAGRFDTSSLPALTLLRAGSNLGYGRAANLVMRTTASRRILLANPDVQVTPYGVARLLQAADALDPPASIVAPATRTGDHAPGASPRDTHWLSGCVMLLDVAAMRESGMFDENIFLYSEDTELCQRLAAAGRRMVLCPDIYFPHVGGGSVRADAALERLKWWHFGWSNCYRMAKHGSTTCWRNPYRKMLSWYFRSWLPGSTQGRLKWRAKADGARAFLRGESAFDANGNPKESP